MSHTSNKPATLDDFLRPFVRRYERGVRVPFVGKVAICNLRESERQATIKKAAKRTEAEARACWFVATVCDDSKAQDPPKLFTDEHIPALSDLDTAASATLMAAINKHCGFDLTSAEDLEKNSEGSPTGASPSS